MRTAGAALIALIGAARAVHSPTYAAGPGRAAASGTRGGSGPVGSIVGRGGGGCDEVFRDLVDDGRTELGVKDGVEDL